MTDKTEEDRIADLLKGKTMRVYALLLTQDTMRLRDIQYQLGFSSPSLVLHHLSKLIDADLVQKDAYGDYSIKKDVRVGSLTLFVRVGRYFIPRFLFQATLLSCLLVPYIMFFMDQPPQGKDILFIVVCITSIAFFVYEAYRMWFLKPT